MKEMISPDSDSIKLAITIRFHAPFAGKDNWNIRVPISPGENLISVFNRLEEDLYQELKEKILAPGHPRFAVAINGKIVAKEGFYQIPLKGMEQVTILALLVGG